MKLKKLNSGIIYTSSKCIGCNKCISGCIALGANVVIKSEELDQYTVMVDPNKCVLCGHCVEECVHKARTYRDDTDAFFDAIERGESISVLVAPSLFTSHEEIYHNILGYLKHLGVKHIYNTSFGADIMVWVYMNFIRDFGLTGVISQFCPVIVNYLEKYKPELLSYLMPVQSPMICTAIYVKDYLKINDTLCYISPCIAEKHEIEDVNTYGRVSYNVTFNRLMERLREVDLGEYYAEDEVSYGLGALVSSAGGLSSNIKPYIGFNKVLIQTSGYQNIFPYFDHYSKEFDESGELPFLVDVLSCTNGCNFGTGTACGVEQRNKVTFSAHRARENAYHSGNVPTGLDYEERLNLLNKRFEAFELSSFVRQYDSTGKVVHTVLSEEQFEAIFHSMYKDIPEHRNTDCGSCGYKTCLDMAYAIGTNVNHKENCINYSKQRIRLETEKTSRLLEEISTMNEELKKSAQLKSNFLANMSHEIRTPMNAVIGMAEMALRGDLHNEERGYIQQIKASGRSLLAIINDILDFSKIESGKMELNETDYAVMSLINDTVNIVMTRIGEKNITLIVDADPNIPYSLHGDDIRIKQVLVNFANNAVKFTEGGYVKVSLQHKPTPEGIILVISIQDSGIGIKESDLEKLFNSFQQIDSKRNRNIEGTGLGLAISREFVRLMDGEIHVESVYGRGSTFSFEIPQKIVVDSPSISLKADSTIKTASVFENLYVREGFVAAIAKLDVENRECFSVEDVEEAIAAGIEFVFIDCPLWNDETEAFIMRYPQVQPVIVIDPRKDIITSTQVRKLNQPVYSLNVAAVLNHETEEPFREHSGADAFRFEAPDAQILIVDDNSINLTVAKGLLSPLRMQITTASGAMEAIQLLESKAFDIVLMDHMMPEIDGIEATHLIRNLGDDYFTQLPIIALTANAINNAREMFIQEGMNDFVAKPIDLLDIAAKIRKWLPAEKVCSIIKTESSPAMPPPELEVSSATGILAIESLDVKAAIRLTGSLELYMQILGDYYDVIEKKADLIERYEKENNLEAYTIEVHALKSASRLIGATELSDLAATLEKCGHEKQGDPIHADTPRLLSLYRSYIPLLAPYCKRETLTPEVVLSSEEIREILEKLQNSLEDFDIDAAAQLLETLKGCVLVETQAQIRERLSNAVEDLEYDDAVEVAQEWVKLLEPYPIATA